MLELSTQQFGNELRNWHWRCSAAPSFSDNCFSHSFDVRRQLSSKSWSYVGRALLPQGPYNLRLVPLHTLSFSPSWHTTMRRKERPGKDPPPGGLKVGIFKRFTRKCAADGLETSLRALKDSSDAFPPLKSVVGSVIAIYDVAQVGGCCSCAPRRH